MKMIRTAMFAGLAAPPALLAEGAGVPALIDGTYEHRHGKETSRHRDALSNHPRDLKVARAER
jgi:hypothetical protein